MSHFDTVQCKVLDEKKLIPRRIPCEEFLKREPASVLSIGSFVTRMKTNPIWKHCEVGAKPYWGSLPLGDGMMFLKWWVEEGNIFFHIDVPEGYSYEIENLSKMKLIKSELYKKMPLEH